MVGSVVMVARLVGKDLRRRRAEAALLVLVMAAAAAALTLALALRGVAANPYEVTRDATTGPDVVLSDLFGRVPAAQFAALADQPGVTSHSGPFPVAAATLHVGTVSVPVTAEGRDSSTAPVDQPKVAQGTWVSPGAIVVERSFADALGVHAGQHVVLAGHSFRIAGVAVTAAAPAYPMSSPGLIWMTRSDAKLLGAPAAPIYYTLKLRLADSAQATAFIHRLTSTRPVGSRPSTMSWYFIREQDATLISNTQQDFLIGASLLALLGSASVAVLVGGRMAEQTRRVGLLKAVGATPTLIAAILLAQNLLLAIAAAALGITTGSLIAPTLASPGAGLIGPPGATTINLTTVAAGLGLTLGVTLLASFIPARRAAKAATMRSLTDAAHPPRRAPWLLAASAALPTPLLVGLRLAARRPRRAILAAASIAITVATIVAVLIFEQYARTASQRLGSSAIANPKTSRDSHVLFVIAVMLTVLAAINIAFLAWAAAIDSRRPLAIVRSIGATPRQARTALVSAQLAPAAAGGLVGVPLGIGLYAATSSSHTIPLPPAWTLATATAVVLLVAATVATIPARRDTNRPAGSLLKSDS